MSKTAILVLADDRGISTFPAVYNTAAELKKRGWGVKIYTGSICDNSDVMALFDEYKVIKSSINLRIRFLAEIFLFSSNLLKVKNKKLIFAFEPRDAIACSFASFFNKHCKYIYYNLEIQEYDFSSNESKLLKFLKMASQVIRKKLETLYSQNAYALVIQDKVRLEILKKHGISNSKYYFIPNSYMSENIECSKVKHKDKGDLLYCGGLEKWSISSMIDSLPRMESLRLTFSGWSRDNYLSTVEQKLQSLGVKVYKQKLSLEDYKELIRNYDVGLVWYSDLSSDNVRYMGRSSGKYFMFLSQGKPVIVQNLPGLADDVKQYSLGVVLESLDQLNEAMKEIMENYADYQRNVIKTYKDVYAYENASKTFFNEIDVIGDII